MKDNIICSGALFYTTNTKRFLFIQRTDSKTQGMWGLVGGKSKFTESAFEGLKREIKEEIGVKTKKLVKLTTYCPVPGYSDEIVHVYYAEVEKIKFKSLYNKNENEEIKIFKLTLSQLKKINESKSIQNVLTKISIYEYLKKFKKS